MRWPRRLRWLSSADLDDKFLRPAFADAVRNHHPDYDDAEVESVVEQMMEFHRELESQ